MALRTRPGAAAPWSNRCTPITWTSMTLTIGTALGLYQWVKYEQGRRAKLGSSKLDVSVGEAQVGGPFALRDTAGKPFTDENLKGEFALLYFGFTFCPDICPDELDKMVEALHLIEKKKGTKVQPVFITIDPERDTPQLLKRYLAEFNERIIGLWGTMDEIKKVAKAYRVYFMKTNDSKDDYLVDHSIIMYFLNPEGKFLTFYGKNFTAQQLADSICDHISEWKASHPDYKGCK